jgi:integrase
MQFYEIYRTGIEPYHLQGDLIMANNKFNFTDNRLIRLKPNVDKKRYYFYDSKQDGLRLQITPTGTKSFQFQVWDKNRQKPVTITLGKYPSISIWQAREKASKEMVAVNCGEDVEESMRIIKNEAVFSDIFFQWLEVHAKPHKKSWKEDERQYLLYIKKPLGKKKLSWFVRDKIRKWHSGITKMQKQRGEGTISGTTANRALTLLNTVFNHMLPDSPNPCKGIKKFKEQSRDRFLQPDELKRFFEVLNTQKISDILRSYILLSLFTGARRSNVMAMKWSCIDLKQKLWIIPGPETKNLEPLPVPLVDQAIEILKNRKKTAESIFVFPGIGKTGHIVEPKKAWYNLINMAGLIDIRLHDLRRTLGSYQTIGGTSLTIVGKTLGHKSTQATQVYARLNLDPVRHSMEKAANLMTSTKDLPEKGILLQHKG